MSAQRRWVVTCDAKKVGLPTCLHSHEDGITSLIDVRAVMRYRGWVRKIHGDIAVDLCRPCAQKADTLPAHVPTRGRPKKVSV